MCIWWVLRLMFVILVSSMCVFFWLCSILWMGMVIFLGDRFVIVIWYSSG